jgi:hypothetical protein
VLEVGEDDPGEVDLEQIELLAQDQRAQQVERAGEDVEVELERAQGQGGSVTGIAETLPVAAAAPSARTGHADAHHVADVGQRLPRDRACALGTRREDGLELRLVGAQLRVALADRREVLRDRLGHRRLEVPVARVGVGGLHRLSASSR